MPFDVYVNGAPVWGTASTPDKVLVNGKRGEIGRLLVASDKRIDIMVREVDGDSISRDAAPIADAGADVISELATLVTLDGSGSTGSNLTYAWELLSGTGGTLDDDAIAGPTYTSDAVIEDDSIWQLTVTDDQGRSDTDQVTVSVATFPVADAGIDIISDLASLVTLDGSGSTGVGLTYQWTLISGTGGTLNDDTVVGPTYTSDAVIEDDSVWELVVTDYLLRASVANEVTVSVAVPQAADAGPDQNVANNVLVTLDGTGSAGRNITYAWTKISGTGGTLSDDTVAQPTYTTDAAIDDTTVWELEITDDLGRTDTDQVSIIVA